MVIVEYAPGGSDAQHRHNAFMRLSMRWKGQW
jgi:hypothetical protein